MYLEFTTGGREPMTDWVSPEILERRISQIVAGTAGHLVNPLFPELLQWNTPDLRLALDTHFRDIPGRDG
jgi:hypothetical protein